MLRHWIRKPSAHELLQPDFGFQKSRINWLSLGIAILLSTLLSVTLTYYWTITVQVKNPLQALREENEKMKTDLAETSIRIQQEKAIHEEMERQIQEQSSKMKKLQDELAFFKMMKKP